MRRAEAEDLSTLNLAAVPIPERGEILMRDTIAPALALRLRASGARTWVVFDRVAGKTVRTTLGEFALIPLEAARRMASAQAAPRDATSAPGLASLFGPDARIKDVMPHYLASGEKGRWKASTLRNMRALADAHILPLLGTRKVREVTREEVTRWHLDVTAQSKAARMALSTLSGLMLYAEDHGVRPSGTNPCKGLRKKQRSQRGQLLPATTMKRLWQALDRLQDQMPDACDAVRLLILTGARRSEILGLEWERIIGPRAVLEDSKTGPRVIWLNTPARAILDARRGADASGYVFPAPRRSGPMTIIDRQWTAIRTEAGIGQLRLHDLRHHFASLAVSNGIDLRLVGQLLGHHDLDSTLGYAHIATSALSKSASRVSGLIDRSLRGKRSTPAPRPRRSAASKQEAANG